MLWFLLFVIWPLAELYVILRVAAAIGAIWMLVALVISWPVGTRVLRRQGRAAWRAFVEATQEGRVPTQEAVNGALVLIGGILLMVPGFISDAIGLLLLAPPSRALARVAVARYATSGWIGNAARLRGSTGAGRTFGPFHRRGRGSGRSRSFGGGLGHGNGGFGRRYGGFGRRYGGFGRSFRDIRAEWQDLADRRDSPAPEYDADASATDLDSPELNR